MERPIVSFLIPLRPKADENTWVRTCKLLERTCGSLLNQSNGRFRVVVAGHDCPAFLSRFNDGRFEFHEVDYGREVPKQSKRRDRNWKVAFAGIIASKDNPLYYMSLDADDLVHKNLVNYVERNQAEEVLLLEVGYEWNLKLNRICLRKDFHRRCGSCCILRASVFPLPKKDHPEDRWKMVHLTVPHNAMLEWANENGFRIRRERKFALATYVTDHGSNLSVLMRASSSGASELKARMKRWLGFLLVGSRPDSHWLSEFGVRGNSREAIV